VTETLWPDAVSLADASKQAATVTDAVIERLLVVPSGLEARVYDAMRYAALAPGKRLRPLLVLASARLFGVSRRSALQVAAAIEQLLDVLPKGKLLSWVFSIPFVRGLADRFYRWFARNRYKLGCGDHCQSRSLDLEYGDEERSAS